MNLKEKLYTTGWDYIDISPLTGNEIYTDHGGNRIEILTDVTELEE